MRQLTPLFLALFLVIVRLSVPGGNARAGDIYCNNQGHDCSDRPSPGATMVRATAVPVGGYGEAPPQQNTTSNSSATNSTVSSPDAGANDRLKQDATRTAVQKDVAISRAGQCKQAKEKYQQSVEARRVYRVNKAGEREYLSDAEADQARVNARLEMDRSCGSSAS